MTLQRIAFQLQQKVSTASATFRHCRGRGWELVTCECSGAGKGVVDHLPNLLEYGSSSLCGIRRDLPEAHSSLHAATLEQMRSSTRSALTPSRAHCQTIIRFQPASRHAASLRLSRLTFFDHFSIQKAMFDFGIVESLHPCLCQKHPRTSIIVFALGITMSGLPLSRLSHTLNRQPSANSLLRTRISGKVSLPRIFAIKRLRCSVVNVSISNQSVVCIFSKRPAWAPVSMRDNLHWIRPSAPIPLHLCNLRLPFVDRIKNYLVPHFCHHSHLVVSRNNAQAVSMHSTLKDSFNPKPCISCLATIFSSSSAFISAFLHDNPHPPPPALAKPHTHLMHPSSTTPTRYSDIDSSLAMYL